VLHSHANLDTGARTVGFNRGANNIVRVAGSNHMRAKGELSVPLGTLLRYPATQQKPCSSWIYRSPTTTATSACRPSRAASSSLR